ncbi:FAD-dependent oxidoreductase [Nonomuraea candida]|uniref:FAD-dependent oxidoreductase n=1 Tax=Nonomuraea candida TaxID=359159 RepID=UPI0005B871B9|nr:NAD(P)/FAD-dependent oxidoreductase [Nonomuraea candida]
MTKTRQIAIVGGGIGGLCLAQGLHKAGVPVTVYERDRTPADRLQGYRVHIDPHGARALHDCLPPSLWQAFLDTTGSGGQDFGFVTERLRTLLVFTAPTVADPADDHHSASRITLRQVLLSGLDDVVRFGKTYERYERLPDGRTRLFFADGTSETADIVVGADGGNSRVRRQYLPHARRVDTGITTVAGKFPLTPENRKLLARRLLDGPNTVIPPKGIGMFTAPHDLDGSPVAATAGGTRAAGGVGGVGGIGVTEQEGALMDNSSSYLLWAVGAAAGRFPSGLSEMPGEQLQAAVAQMIRSWHPDLRRIVDLSHPDTVSLLPIRTSIPVDPWQADTITLLGDAIHSMTPMAGIGANTALRDARLLCAALTSGGDPVAAIARYEEQMREYGFAAVRGSLRSARQFVGNSWAARLGFKTFLRAAERVPALKARMSS